MLDFEALWPVFLATFVILPVFTAPIPRRQLARRLAITPMPSSETTPTVWITLFDGHFGIAVADDLALPILAGSDNKLLALPRCTPRTIARQFSRIHLLPHLCRKLRESNPGAIVVPSDALQRSLTAC